jgi:hypothetical protein
MPDETNVEEERMRIIGVVPRATPQMLLASLVVTAIVTLQASSCCCCLGGAVTPEMTPFPISRDLAYQMRERLNQTKDREGAFTVEISDQELTSYVVMLLQSGAGEFPARDMQIQFGDGYVDIWATFIEIAPTDLPTFVRVRVEAVDGSLYFRLDQANARAVPIPGAMRELLAQVLSETLAELQYGLEVHQVEITPGKMLLSGRVTGDLPDLPERL